MKLVITEKEQGKIIAKQTVIKLEVNPFSSDAGKMPLSVITAKGDLIAGKGNANPVRISAGTDGQVLVADSNAEGGMVWKVVSLGTATLRNSHAYPVTAGTVVTTTGMLAGEFRIATSADTANIFVAAENIMAGELGTIYNASGKDCTVKVTDGAVNAGDRLTVSATDGVAEVTAGAAYFAQAITNKPAGAAGTVICVLINTVLTIIPIQGGGTNATDAATARNNLGVTALFDNATGHDHDGTDSKKVAYGNLTGLPTLTPAAIGAMLNRPPNIEFQPPAANSGFGGFIDFHYNQSAADYTARIIEDEQGKLKVDPNPAVTLAGLRNIYAGTAKLTPGSSTLATGVIYLVYE